MAFRLLRYRSGSANAGWPTPTFRDAPVSFRSCCITVRTAVGTGGVRRPARHPDALRSTLAPHLMRFTYRWTTSRRSRRPVASACDDRAGPAGRGVLQAHADATGPPRDPAAGPTRYATVVRAADGLEALVQVMPYDSPANDHVAPEAMQAVLERVAGPDRQGHHHDSRRTSHPQGEQQGDQRGDPDGRPARRPRSARALRGSASGARWTPTSSDVCDIVFRADLDVVGRALSAATVAVLWLTERARFATHAVPSGR